MSFCYFNNGYSMTSVDSDYVAQPGELVLDHCATDDELNAAFPGRAAMREANQRAEQNAAIKTQLAELDARSVRALHEAVLAMAAAGVSLPADTLSRLQTIEADKQALRAQLQ